jgi:hypothetical protein
MPVPADAARGFPLDLLFSRLADGQRAAHYALDGHVHTTASPDARLRLGDVVREAAAAGLDAVVITDHCSIAAAPAIAAYDRARPAGAPLLVLGEEAGTRGAHLGLWNVARGARADEGGLPAMATALARVDAQSPGALCVLNHPTWTVAGAALFHPAAFDPQRPGPKFDALEVCNGRRLLRPQTRALIGAWEAMLAQGLRPAIVSGSDAHLRGDGLGRLRTVVIAPALEAGALVEAARLGRTYVTDDARVVFSVAGHGPGELIDGRPGARLDPAAHGPWHVALRGLGQRGGEVRLYAGRALIATLPTTAGVPFSLALDYDPRTRPAAERDRAGYLRVEIVRPAEHGAEEVGLITAPVYFELGTGSSWAARPRAGARLAALAQAPAR